MTLHLWMCMLKYARDIGKAIPGILFGWRRKAHSGQTEQASSTSSGAPDPSQSWMYLVACLAVLMWQVVGPFPLPVLGISDTLILKCAFFFKSSQVYLRGRGRRIITNHTGLHTEYYTGLACIAKSCQTATESMYYVVLP